MEKIIRTIRRYTGRGHAWLHGERVVVVAVHRDDTVLRADRMIGQLRADDWVEFVPLMPDDEGGEQISWVTSDTLPHELGPPDGEWTGLIPTGAAFAIHTSRRELF